MLVMDGHIHRRQLPDVTTRSGAGAYPKVTNTFALYSQSI